MPAQSDSRPSAVEQLQTARQERDRRAAHYESAMGSRHELPAYTDLQAAEQQLTARQAWLTWLDEGY